MIGKSSRNGGGERQEWLLRAMTWLVVALGVAAAGIGILWLVFE